MKPIQEKIKPKKKEEDGKKQEQKKEPERKKPSAKAKIVPKPFAKKKPLLKKAEKEETTKTKTIVVAVVPKKVVKKPKKADIIKKAFDKTKADKKIVKSALDVKKLQKVGMKKPEQKKSKVIPKKVQSLKKSPEKKVVTFKKPIKKPVEKAKVVKSLLKKGKPIADRKKKPTFLKPPAMKEVKKFFAKPNKGEKGKKKTFSFKKLLERPFIKAIPKKFKDIRKAVKRVVTKTIPKKLAVVKKKVAKVFKKTPAPKTKKIVQPVKTKVATKLRKIQGVKPLKAQKPVAKRKIVVKPKAAAKKLAPVKKSVSKGTVIVKKAKPIATKKVVSKAVGKKIVQKKVSPKKVMPPKAISPKLVKPALKQVPVRKVVSFKKAEKPKAVKKLAPVKFKQQKLPFKTPALMKKKQPPLQMPKLLTQKPAKKKPIAKKVAKKPLKMTAIKKSSFKKAAGKVAVSKPIIRKPSSVTKPKGTTLKVSPKGGVCICPICGTRHYPGQHSHGMEKKTKPLVKTGALKMALSQPKQVFERKIPAKRAAAMALAKPRLMAKPRVMARSVAPAKARIVQPRLAAPKAVVPRPFTKVAQPFAKKVPMEKPKAFKFPTPKFMPAPPAPPLPPGPPSKPPKGEKKGGFFGKMFGKKSDAKKVEKMGKLPPQLPPVMVMPPEKPTSRSKALLRKIGGLFMKKKEEPPPKPTIGQRIKGAIRRKWNRTKYRISNSIVGKAWRGIKKTAKFVGKVAMAPVKVAWGAAKLGYKATKFAAKTFVGATKIAAKATRFVARKAVSGIGGFFKGLFEDIQDLGGGKGGGKGGAKGGGGAKAAKGGKGSDKDDQIAEIKMRLGFKPRGLIQRIVDWSPAAAITKVGFRIIKWGVKKLWKGIKKLVFKAISFFKSLFKIGGKFVNKLSFWVAKLGKGIVNKTYRFLVKPIANMMFSVFGFMIGLIMSPIKFMQWLIPSVFQKIRDTLSNIKHGVKKLLKSTWSIFKKILFNPLTIALLVGGLFLFFCPGVLDMLSGGLQGIKDNLWPILKGVGETIWNFVCGAWDIIMSVGAFLFKWIDKITDPEGWVVTTVGKIINAILTIKRWMTKMMKAAGKDSIDVFCMFLAGDMIGIVVSMIAGICVKIWKYIKHRGVFKLVLGLIKVICMMHVMIAGLALAFIAAILSAAATFIGWLTGFCSLGDIPEAFCKPFKIWWAGVNALFESSGAKDDIEQPELKLDVMAEDPREIIAKIRGETNISVKKLKITHVNASLEKFEETASKNEAVYGKMRKGELRTKIENMNKLFQWNAEQTMAYDDFIAKAWEKGKGSDDASRAVMTHLLESSELSQRLLSVFYYYNPQTREVMMLRPASYIGMFLNNIREMVSDEDRDDQEAFKTIIMAFEQMNVERTDYVNKQGEAISKFANKLVSFGQGETRGGSATKQDEAEIMEMIKKLNKGDMFDSISYSSSFDKMADEDHGARSQDQTSITGESFGTNELLKVPHLVRPEMGGNQIPRDKFVMQKQEKPPINKIGRVTVPPGMYPAPHEYKDQTKDGKSILELYLEHQEKRREALRSGKTTEQADAMGLKNMTYEQFKENYRANNQLDEAQEQKRDEDKAKRLASMRLAADIDAYNNQGEEASADGFKLGAEPHILQIPLNGISTRMLMFSPEWDKVQGASKKSDKEFMLDLNQLDAEAIEQERKAKQAELKRQKEEKKRREREDAILNYSAKISKDGFIEVKMGEDVPAMQEAYKVHMQKRREGLSKGATAAQMDKAGLKNYTWEQWKRYYRKMHGLPEDGIKRIPIDAKKKPREVDWSKRYPLSVDELGKFGIQMSEDGPVMIPLDKAMEVANSLLKDAKTIYSIRDGLEVMRQGLDVETKNLKQRREGGVPIGVMATGQGTDNPTASTADPTPSNVSSYAEVG